MTNASYTPAYFAEVEKSLLKFGFKLVTHGKVRDVYSFDDQLIMITTDRISAFDVVSPQTIPYKGQILNKIAAHFLDQASVICPTWLKAVPNSNTSIGLQCEPIKIEMVIRGHLCGSAWRKYMTGERVICGEVMPDGMVENDQFPTPIITPTTKADTGHDEEITKDEIIKRGLATQVNYTLMENYTRQLFKQGSESAKESDFFLVDTKYEFGLSKNGAVTLIDEVNTPDSSRYFQMKGYYRRQRENKPQIQLSKEYLREWLMSQGYKGQSGVDFPFMPEEIVSETFLRYKVLYERLTKKNFTPEDLTPCEFIQSIVG